MNNNITYFDIRMKRNSLFAWTKDDIVTGLLAWVRENTRW